MTRDTLRAGAAIAIAAAVVGVVQTRAADAYHQAKETSDVYALPPPDDVVKLSLGYRAAFLAVTPPGRQRVSPATENQRLL